MNGEISDANAVHERDDEMFRWRAKEDARQERERGQQVRAAALQAALQLNGGKVIGATSVVTDAAAFLAFLEGDDHE